MFTGIIQEVGVVRGSRQSGGTARLQIETKSIAQPVLGESIAVNGTCLTVSRAGHHWFEADVMPKTWECTNLSLLGPRDFVNLERALRAGDALGGHMVSGHVDGLGTVRSIKPEKNAVLVEVSIPQELAALLIWKGSVAVDGVSLTIQSLSQDRLTVSLIPHTFAETRFPKLKVGSKVNIETDMMAKHAIQTAEVTPKKELTLEFLKEHGFA